MKKKKYPHSVLIRISDRQMEKLKQMTNECCPDCPNHKPNISEAVRMLIDKEEM